MTVVARPEWATSTRDAGDQVIHERQIVISDGSFHDEWAKNGHGHAVVQIERWDQVDREAETCKVGPVQVYVEVPSRSLNLVELRQLTEALGAAVELAAGENGTQGGSSTQPMSISTWSI
jgi:hypothetical protein